MKESLSIVTPIVTLVLGWFLNSFAPFFASRREHKRALARAISALLEVRYSLFANELLMKEIRTGFGLTANEQQAVISVVRTFIPDMAEVSKSYNEAILTIAASDPLLAYSLRSKDFAAKFSGIIAQAEKQAGTSIPVGDLESTFNTLTFPHVSEQILILSRQHSIFTRWKVGRYLSRPLERPKELDTLLNQIKADVKTLIDGERTKTASFGPHDKQSLAKSVLAE